MSLSERQKREKQLRICTILTAAKELYSSKGYQETSMVDIAQAAELGKATIYYYFPNKEAIYRELFISSVRDQFNQLSVGIESATSLKELLTSILYAYIDWAYADPQFFGLHFPWGKNAPVHIMEEPDVLAELMELHRPVHGKINSILADIADEFDPQIVSGMIWTFMSGLAQKIHQGLPKEKLIPEIDLYISCLTNQLTRNENA